VNSLRQAIEDIDGVLGAGYSKAHPELLAAFVQAGAVYNAAGRISGAIGDLHEALRSDHPLQAQTFDGIETALQAIADAASEADPTSTLGRVADALQNIAAMIDLKVGGR
jgi:hypothetical protein